MKCLTAACWHGEYQCDESNTASTVDLTVGELAGGKAMSDREYSAIHNEMVGAARAHKTRDKPKRCCLCGTPIATHERACDDCVSFGMRMLGRKHY